MFSLASMCGATVPVASLESLSSNKSSRMGNNNNNNNNNGSTTTTTTKAFYATQQSHDELGVILGMSPSSSSSSSSSSSVVVVAVDDQSSYSLWQKCLAEAIGTGMIVGGGCGAVCATKYGGAQLNALGIAASFGISVALAVYTTRDISGAHLNPAITASLAMNHNKDTNNDHIVVAPYYILSQLTGATAAGALNYVAYRKGIDALHVTENVKRGSGTKASSALFNGAFHMIPNKAMVATTPGAFFVEIVLTSCLAFVIFALTDQDKKQKSKDDASMEAAVATPALIGATVTALVTPGIPLTGCGMNPARDLGPRLVAATLGGLGWRAAFLPGWWIYTAGPIVGGVAGGAFYNAAFRSKSI